MGSTGTLTPPTPQKGGAHGTCGDPNPFQEDGAGQSTMRGQLVRHQGRVLAPFSGDEPAWDEPSRGAAAPERAFHHAPSTFDAAKAWPNATCHHQLSDTSVSFRLRLNKTESKRDLSLMGEEGEKQIFSSKHRERFGDPDTSLAVHGFSCASPSVAHKAGIET